MKFVPHQVFHVFNQGNNRQRIFFEHENYLYFLRKTRKYILPLADVLCYCLMPNHFHFLIVAKEEASALSKAIKPQSLEISDHNPAMKHEIRNQEMLSQAIGILLSSYTKAINKRFDRSGSLFRNRTKVKSNMQGQPIALVANRIDSLTYLETEHEYARNCFHYIHDNPVKAGLVDSTLEWPYSSAMEFAGLREETLCNLELVAKLQLM